MTVDSNRFLLLYGSQTGQAQAIAEELVTLCSRESIEAEIHCFSKTEKEFCLEREPLVVIVTSTTGDGEPPDTVQKFWRRIKKKTVSPEHFKNVKYALLGLGDSNYSNFCNCAKIINNRLQELGAEHFIKPHFADDATGIETVVEPWLELIVKSLKSHFNITTSNCLEDLKLESLSISTMDEKPNQTHQKHTWSRDFPHMELSTLTLPSAPLDYIKITRIDSSQCEQSSGLYQNGATLPFINSELVKLKIKNIKLLTRHDAVKKTLHVTLDNQGRLEYEPGDAFSILSYNDEREVQLILDRIDYEADSLIKLEVKPDTLKKRAVIPEFINKFTTPREILTNSLNIRSTTKKTFLRRLADFCSDITDQHKLRYLSSKQGADNYRLDILESRRTILDVLTEFKSCRPTFECLLENLPRNLPRAYSVCSYDPSIISFTFNLLTLPDVGEITPRFGLTTGRFHKIYEQNDFAQQTVECFMRSQTYFRPPEDPLTPLILIGPGTGVSPYLSFLEYRQKLSSSGTDIGSCYLLFGNRHEDRDFLFREEFERYLQSDIITELYTSFSRDLDTKFKYVTDLIKHKSSLLSDLIMRRSAVIYVCGDARNMAKDVNTAISDIIKQENGLTDDEVIEVMKALRVEGRYREDVWT